MSLLCLWGGFPVLMTMMGSSQSEGQPALSMCKSSSLTTDHCNMDHWMAPFVGTTCIKTDLSEMLTSINGEKNTRKHQ